MTTRTILTAVTAIVVAGTAATALAAGSVKDPKTLVLQKSDFPAGARKVRTLRIPGQGVSANLAVTFRYRAPTGGNELTSSVTVLKNSRQARTAFKASRKSIEDALRVLPKKPRYAVLDMPRYGDEQFATHHPLDGGKLLVRKNTVVWFLLLNSVPGEGRLTLSNAEAAVELKKYGAKQQRRVGSG